MAGKPLTPKQQRFVEEYPVDLNGTQAAIRAGFSPRTAASQAERLLRNVEIQRRIASALAARSERTEVTQDYILANLVLIVERCMQRAPVVVGGVQVKEDGKDLWTFQAKPAIEALHLLGKHLKMFGDKLDVNMHGPPFKLYQGFDPDAV